MEDDWDLQAVVRSCVAAATTTTTTTTTTINTDAHDPLSRFQPQQDDRFPFFPDPFEVRRKSTIEELHDLYKPFFPKSPPLSPQNIPISPLSVLGGLQDLSQQQQQQQQQQLLQANQSVGGSVNTLASSGSAASRHNQNPRSKRRKIQMKRVCEMPAEGLSSDMWSWRKYGQKPIKGSPYPRGYYRCSTSKGCLARKQVERNRYDPGMFIVTYTADHNHPMPTHRNSLAGSIRQKPVTAGDSNKPNCSPPVSPAATLSPVTEKTENMEDVVEEEEDKFGVSDVVMGDDFFEGLEDLAGTASEDSFSNEFPASFQFPWLCKNAKTTAAGGG